MAENILQFAPFTSTLDAGFWYQLSHKKLNIYKLEDKPVQISGFYANWESLGIPPIANIDYTAFSEDVEAPPRSFPLKGILLNTNTLEEFKQKDKQQLIQLAGMEIWNDIKNGSALENPSLLQRFLCLTFADLKKYHYYYWIAFPAFVYPEVHLLQPSKKMSDIYSSEQMEQFLKSYNDLSAVDKISFLIYESEATNVSFHKLTDYDSLLSKQGKISLGFSDPSSLESYPGWPLRNLLSLVAYMWGKEKKIWDVICFRETIKECSRYCGHSLLLNVEFTSFQLPEECPKIVGWEKYQNKYIPRFVDMSSSMDPTKLADAAVDLNLKLMRWRVMPDLDLDSIKHTKCLLLGAGTLGCNVARCLMGWGVRNITLVDNAKVSFSNPIRQTLFNFEDCMSGGKLKAEAAADSLKKIFPGINAKGVFLNIPMPGHAVSEKVTDNVHDDVKKLEDLIHQHDVIFLLMDTRESRWLPTLLGCVKEKIVINAALGFDTYLIMRHGQKGMNSIGEGNSSVQLPGQIISGFHLGCYFCNDVVAPGNSMRDRTLDQQCTVTRPGISYIAAAIAVELMVSIIQHPKKGAAPAVATFDEDMSSNKDLTTSLGIIPHQVRGYMDRFQNILHLSKSFERCIACSSKVIKEYEAKGFEFLLQVFNSPNYLEDLTGLTELLQNFNIDDVLELSDEEES